MVAHSKRLFYGWYMVGAGSAMQFLQAGLMTQSFGAYVAVLQAERGWSKTALSGAAALQQMETAILGPIIGWFIDRFGPQGMIRVGLPAALVIKRRPEDHGLTVDGLPPKTPESTQELRALTLERDFTAREALRTPAFWLLSLGHGFALLVVHAVSVHSITHMNQGLGYSVEQAALVYTLLTLSQIGGVAIGWWIGDRYKKRLIAAACMLMHMTGLLLLTYAVNVAMVLSFAVLHGAAWGLRGPFMQAIRADYFGRSAIGMILGLSLMIVVIGQVGGPMIAGIAADLTGNYRSGFTILALLAGLGSLFFILARKPKRPLR